MNREGFHNLGKEDVHKMKVLDYKAHGTAIDGGSVPLHARAKSFRRKRQQNCRRRRSLVKKQITNICQKLQINKKGAGSTAKNSAKKKKGERKRRFGLSIVGNQVGSMLGAAVGASSGPFAVLGVPASTAIGGVVGGVAGKVADTILLTAVNGLVQRFARGIGQPPPTIGRPPPSSGFPPRSPPSGGLSPPPPLGGQRPPPPEEGGLSQQKAASEQKSPPPAIRRGGSSVASQVTPPSVDQSFNLRKIYIQRKTMLVSEI